MQRRWLVRPDHEVGTYLEDGSPGPPMAAVSQDALLMAVLDGAKIIDRAGGVLSVVPVRAKTGVPGEMVTVAATVEWKDHTRGRPQPEREGPAQDPLEAEAEQAIAGGADPKLVAEAVAAARERPVGVNDHGAEVDESDVPAELRGG